MLTRFTMVNTTRQETVELEKDIQGTYCGAVHNAEKNFIRWCYRHGYIAKGDQYSVNIWCAWNT